MCEKKISLQEFYDLKIKDIMLNMKSEIPYVTEKTDVTAALSILNTKDHVWVLDNKEPAQLVGVITESDTLVLFSPPITSLQSFDKPDSRSLQFGEILLVEDIMSKKPITASPDNTVKDILLKMNEQKIKHLPVVDDDLHLIGEISLHNLIQKYLIYQNDFLQNEQNEKT